MNRLFQCLARRRLENGLGLLVLLSLGTFLARRSLVLGVVACAVAAAVAGFVVGRHVAERRDTSSEAPKNPPPGSKDRAAVEANPSINRSPSAIAQRFRQNAAEGIPTAVVVLDLAPISDRSRSLNPEQFLDRAVEAVSEVLHPKRHLMFAGEGRRLLVLMSHAGETEAAEFTERARTALWRRGRIASKAGFACTPKDGRALIAVLHRARRRAAAARYSVPVTALRPPSPLGQRFSERV